MLSWLLFSSKRSTNSFSMKSLWCRGSDDIDAAKSERLMDGIKSSSTCKTLKILAHLKSNLLGIYLQEEVVVYILVEGRGDDNN